MSAKFVKELALALCGSVSPVEALGLMMGESGRKLLLPAVAVSAARASGVPLLPTVAMSAASDSGVPLSSNGKLPVVAFVLAVESVETWSPVGRGVSFSNDDLLLWFESYSVRIIKNDVLKISSP